MRPLVVAVSGNGASCTHLRAAAIQSGFCNESGPADQSRGLPMAGSWVSSIETRTTRWGSRSVHLDPVRGQRGSDRLEECRPADGAVAASAGGETQGRGAVVERSAAVSGLGADRRLDEPADRTA